MFLGLKPFLQRLLSKSPAVGLVVWNRPEARAACLSRLAPAIRKARRGTIVTSISASELDSATFEIKLKTLLARKDAPRTVLIISDMEPMLSAAGRILNGYRERLSGFRAILLIVRGNRLRDFQIQSPDLIDWVGLMVARVEDLAPPLTLREVNASISFFEQ